MFSRGLRKELRWLLLVIAAALVVGLSIEALALSLVLGLLGFIVWLFSRLAALEAWVSCARRSDPPPDNFGGVWGEIADDVRLLCKRYEKDKVRLQAVVTRVQEMTSALTDSVVLVDNRANIEWWNRSAEKLLHFQAIDRGHKLVNILRNPRFLAYFEKEDYEQPLALESMRREGQHLEFHVHTFGQGERLVVIRDVTRVCRLEQMRKDFVSNVSHELRTPLTVIKGYIETLLDAPAIPSTWQAALTQMHHQSNRMTALINDLITLSRLETDQTELKPKPILLAHLIQTIISDAKVLSGEGRHEFSFIGDADISLLGNEQELRSAISNLIFNAVKYSPDGGKVKIEINAAAEEFTISISDQGLGIDPKHITRITERFYRVDDSRSTALGGTGLGLAIVKHVLMRHEGKLKIHSRLGEGSTFTCHFPISRVLHQKVA